MIANKQNLTYLANAHWCRYFLWQSYTVYCLLCLLGFPKKQARLAQVCASTHLFQFQSQVPVLLTSALCLLPFVPSHSLS